MFDRDRESVRSTPVREIWASVRWATGKPRRAKLAVFQRAAPVKCNRCRVTVSRPIFGKSAVMRPWVLFASCQASVVIDAAGSPLFPLNMQLSLRLIMIRILPPERSRFICFDYIHFTCIFIVAYEALADRKHLIIDCEALKYDERAYERVRARKKRSRNMRELKSVFKRMGKKFTHSHTHTGE